jgi:hypothetical protein
MQCQGLESIDMLSFYGVCCLGIFRNFIRKKS